MPHAILFVFFFLVVFLSLPTSEHRELLLNTEKNSQKKALIRYCPSDSVRAVVLTVMKWNKKIKKIISQNSNAKKKDAGVGACYTLRITQPLPRPDGNAEGSPFAINSYDHYYYYYGFNRCGWEYCRTMILWEYCRRYIEEVHISGAYRRGICRRESPGCNYQEHFFACSIGKSID